MKKILCMIVLLCTMLNVHADMFDKTIVSSYKSEYNHSGIFLNPTLGFMTGDAPSAIGLDLMAGYRWNFAGGFSWDIIKISANTGLDEYSSDLFTLRFLTGLRYNSPGIIAGKSLYADIAIGYCTTSGLTYDFSIGLNLSKRISLGLNVIGIDRDYSNTDYYGSTIAYGLLGVRLGINF